MCWSPAAGVCELGSVGHVAGGYSDGSVRIFGVASAEMELKLQPPHHGAVSALQYSHHGELKSTSNVYIDTLILVTIITSCN